MKPIDFNSLQVKIEDILFGQLKDSNYFFNTSLFMLTRKFDVDNPLTTLMGFRISIRNKCLKQRPLRDSKGIFQNPLV